jgi:hypothetical protein
MRQVSCGHCQYVSFKCLFLALKRLIEPLNRYFSTSYLIRFDYIYYLVITTLSMKRILLLAFVVSSLYASAQMSGTKKIGVPLGSGCAGPCDYTSITAVGGLFEAVNGGGGINGNVVAQIYTDLTEDGSNVLSDFIDAGGPHTILIQPVDANMRILSGVNDGDGLIPILGGDRVILDGREPGDITSSHSTGRFLTIRNTSLLGPAITVSSDAVSVSLRFLIIESSNASNLTGSVEIGGGSISGNDDLVIDYCDIKDAGGALPWCGINLKGGVGQNNDNLRISNNYIYNFYANGINGGFGINLGNFNSTVTITGNSFFQTADRSLPGSHSYTAIRVSSASGNSINVLNNFIGGTAPDCGGSVTTFSATVGPGGAVLANLIDMDDTGFSALSLVSGNTIKNIATSSVSSTGAAEGALTGITVRRGLVDVRDNIIGDATGGLTANYNATAFASGGRISGIEFLTNTSGAGIEGVIEGNRIDNLVLNSTGATASSASEVSGIYIDQQTDTDPIVVKNNLIGNLNGVVRITTNNTASNVLNTIGINVFRASVTVTLDRNKIANISSQGLNTSSFARGISSTASATLQAESNLIFNISSSVNNVATTGATVGIFASNATAPALLISKNTVYNLSNTNAVTVAGVLVGAVNGGVNPRIENNMITLGNGQASNTRFLGIYNQTNNAGTAQVYANSVVITGAGAGGNTSTTSAFFRESTTVFELRANILFTNRTGGGNHHALASTTGSPGTSNFNLLFSAMAGNLTNVGGVPRDFATWRGASGQDLNSVNTDISSKFISIPNGNLRIPDDGSALVLTNIVDMGSASVGTNPVSDDVDKAHRANLTDIGASEVLVTWLGGTSADWNTASNWSGSIIPSCGGRDLIKIGPGVPNQPTISGATVGNFRELVILEGATLTLSGSGSLEQCATVSTPFSLIVNGTLTVSGSQAIILYGDFYQNNTFSHGTGTFSLLGSSTQAIDGDEDPIQFYNVVINGTGVKTLNQQVKITNILDLTNGVIITTTNNLLIFTATGNYTGGDEFSHVNGPVAKETTFTTPTFYFPIGKGSKYRPLGIEPSNATATTFIAEYFDQSAIATIGSAKVASLQTVSNVEYWRIDRGTTGSANSKVHLTWDAASGVSANPADRALLRVARWDGSKWTNAQQTAISGTASAGELTSGQVNVYNTFFTLASETANNPLPITLLYFGASLEDDQVLLNWATDKEEYFDRFELEKASENLVFTKIATIQPILAGEPVSLREYSHIDAAPYTGYNYYRLKSIDLDGTSEYSKVIGVLYEGTGEKLSVYPNPVIGNVMKIKVPFNPTPQDKVTLLNIQGVEMLHADIKISGEQEITLGNNVSPGMYLLRYSSPVLLKTFKVIVK